MPLIGTVAEQGIYRQYTAIAGVNNNDIVIETTDVSRFDTFELSGGAGAVDVFVNDGIQWLTSPLSLADLGATTNDPVLLTAALQQYGFRGYYRAIRVQQAGVSAATGYILRCAKRS